VTGRKTENRFSVVDISQRLGIGKMSVYAMLEKGELPGIRIGRKWLITRQAYEQWERTCGVIQRSDPLLTVPRRLT
jgi:excisionase family DNA binding protein